MECHRCSSERFVEVPQIQEIIRHVPRVEIQEIVREVVKVEIQVVEKVVEVPQIQTVDKIVEIPQIQEVIRHVPVPQIVDVPYTRHVHVPKIEIQTVEQIRHIPVPQIIDVPVEHIVHVPVHVPQIQTVQRPVPPLLLLLGVLGALRLCGAAVGQAARGVRECRPVPYF